MNEHEYKSVLNDWTLKQSNKKKTNIHTHTHKCLHSNLYEIITTLTMIKYNLSNILITLVLMGADKKTITAETVRNAFL